MENSPKQDMGSGSIKKLMVKMAVPALVGQVVNLLYNVVDRIYIGHIPEVGGTALIGISMPVIKAHGSSNADSFFAAVRQAKQFAESGIIDDIAANVDAMRVRTEQP